MSQYGAYGAARKGLSWKQILAFYYRGTQLSTMPSGTKIKVWITSDNDNSLRILPASGLTVRDTAGHRYTVPSGAKYTSWRISRSGAGYRLSYRTSSGSYVTKSTGLTTGTWSFATRSKIVKVVLPGGSVRTYRGTVALIKSGSGGRTINNVLLEDYVKGVVPAEMPTSWAADAVRAQAVAARSYAVRLRDFLSGLRRDRRTCGGNDGAFAALRDFARRHFSGGLFGCFRHDRSRGGADHVVVRELRRRFRPPQAALEVNDL